MCDDVCQKVVNSVLCIGLQLDVSDWFFKPFVYTNDVFYSLSASSVYDVNN